MNRSRIDRRTIAIWLSTFLVVSVAGCTSGSSASPSPQPAPSGPAQTAGQLRLQLIDQLGPRWFCDPDEYPVAHGSEQENAITRYPEMVAEGDVFTAVANQLGIDLAGALTDTQKRAIYHLWKAAVSIPLDPLGNGQYHFEYLAAPLGSATEGTRTVGTIAVGGAVSIEQQSSAGAPPCPICLSVGTPIDTPDGPVAVEALRLGDPVWTRDMHGRRVAGTVIALGSTPAPIGHRVVVLRLADNRTVTASPGHPLPDGRLIGNLRVGDTVDGSRVVAADLIPYAGADTYDLVASGPTGIYFAGGIPLGSTLR